MLENAQKPIYLDIPSDKMDEENGVYDNEACNLFQDNNSEPFNLEASSVQNYGQDYFSLENVKELTFDKCSLQQISYISFLFLN